MEDFDQRRPDEEEEFNQLAAPDTLDETGQSDAGEPPSRLTESGTGGQQSSPTASMMGERPSILGEEARIELPQRPSILGDSDRPRTGPPQRPSITGREEVPRPPSKRSVSSQPTVRQPEPQTKPPAKPQVTSKPKPATKTAPKKKTTPRKAAPPKKKTRAPADPDWLKRLKKEMPPYADEMLALLMIAIGLVSLLSLIGLASGDLADNWALFLSRTLGVGAAVVPLAIFIAGALLLVPKLGVKVRINWQRVVAGELFFVTLLSYIHLVNSDMDPWAVALAGKGGGWIGWAISTLLRDGFGSTASGFILLVLLAITGGLTLGIGRQQLIAGLAWLRDRALALAEDMEKAPEPRQPPPAKPVETTPAYVSELPPTLPPFPGRPSIVTVMRKIMKLQMSSVASKVSEPEGSASQYCTICPRSSRRWMSTSSPVVCHETVTAPPGSRTEGETSNDWM